MDEQQIADKLKQNLPAPLDTVTPTSPNVQTDEQSSTVDDSPNELMLLKLSNFFNVQYGNEEANQRLKFIYDEASRISGKTDYDSILATINDLLVRQGFMFRPDRFHKLWLYLKLHQEKQLIEGQIAEL